MSIKIKLGTWYVLKNGKVIGPAELNTSRASRDMYPFMLGKRVPNGYTESGGFYVSGVPGRDVVREATVLEVVDQLEPGQGTRHNGSHYYRPPTITAAKATSATENVMVGARQQGKTQKMLEQFERHILNSVFWPSAKAFQHSVVYGTGVDFAADKGSSSSEASFRIVDRLVDTGFADAMVAKGLRVLPLDDSRTPIEKAADEVTGIAETMAEQAKKDKATIDALNKQADIGNKTIRELEAEVRRLKASEQGLYRALNATTQERDRYFNAGQGQQGVIAGKDRVIADLQTAARNANKRADDLLAENNKLRTSQWTGAVYRYDVGGGEYRGVPHSSVEHELTLLYQQVNVARNDARNAHKLADEANARAAKIAKERDALLTK